MRGENAELRPRRNRHDATCFPCNPCGHVRADARRLRAELGDVGLSASDPRSKLRLRDAVLFQILLKRFHVAKYA